MSKFDLAHNAPMPDKAAHVSNKGEKAILREVLLADPRLRPLLRGLRIALDYEARPAWQPPPDVPRLARAIDDASAAFWKRVLRGQQGASAASRAKQQPQGAPPGPSIVVH